MRIKSVKSGVMREPLIAPFGFKGGYSNELWQVASQIDCGGVSGLGVGIQSVLWSDSGVYAATTELGGNEYMYDITKFALKRLCGAEFSTPQDAMDEIMPDVLAFAKERTGNPKLRKTFALNALVSVDNALWQAYAKSLGTVDFMKVVPERYHAALSGHETLLTNIPLITYGLDDGAIRKLLERGYFVLKIKLGCPGTPDEMLAGDKARLLQIHNIAKEYSTQYTDSGKVVYYLDANGRYDSLSRVRELLDYAGEIGALERVILFEEPFDELNKTDVGALPVRVAADESAHSAEDVVERIGLGYTAIALKPIAKTLSESLKILYEAERRGVPCFTADLTVPPILVEFNKNVAARIGLVPGMKIGMLESNGEQNYKNWEAMRGYHPCGDRSFARVDGGLFHLDDDFYKTSGGIFYDAPEYEKILKEI